MKIVEFGKIVAIEFINMSGVNSDNPWVGTLKPFFMEVSRLYSLSSKIFYIAEKFKFVACIHIMQR